MESENKKELLEIIIGAVLLLAVWILDKSLNLPVWGSLLLYLIPYLFIGHEVIEEAAEGIMEGEAFDEDVLMTIATVGALLIGFLPGAEPEFAEAVFVMLFFKVGELFEGIAEGNSRKSIAHLMDIRPDSADVERDGDIQTVSPEEVKVGEIIVLKPGAKVPMDGVVIEGNSSLDTVALTGESVPRSIREGEEIMSGCVNLSGVLRVKVTKLFGESTASKILNLVEEAGERKSTSENFITKFAKIYTPIVVVLAVLLAIVPPLVSGAFGTEFAVWLKRALTFLIVSCPCALVISIPLTFFGGLGGASKAGILIKGSNFLDVLSKIKTVVFDKTGTLTEGVFAVSKIAPEEGVSTDELLSLAACAEKYSTHPIAASIKDACKDDISSVTVENVEEIAGHGVKAVVDGKTVFAGNLKLMKLSGAKASEAPETGTAIYVSIDSIYKGYIIISDKVKESASKAISSLKEAGIKTVMLTGDKTAVAKNVADSLGIDEVHSELLPADKVSHVESLLSAEEGGLAFVGDGINDAPVLARADAGIAMGALGSDAAIEAADVVLMDDNPAKVALAIRIAKRTIKIAKQNIAFALGVKILVLILAALGIATMWMAVFADVGVTVLAVLNATRALKSIK